MRSIIRTLLWVGLAILMLQATAVAAVPGFGMLPYGWTKMSSPAGPYVNVPDGISGDRENSYAWSMEVYGDYLYVGTSRDVLAPMMLALGVTGSKWPKELPIPTDMRGRIYRMKLSTGVWEPVYLCNAVPLNIMGMPIIGGVDLGYRMMKVSSVGSGIPTLYAGSIGNGICRLIAIDKLGNVAPIFMTQKPGKSISIRAITEHDGKLFWASEDKDGPAIWYSSNPAADAAKQQFAKIPVPTSWFSEGAEVWDMISYNGALYVFLTPYAQSELGFWCAKVTRAGKDWKWRLIVGKSQLGARYLPGIGLASNGAGVPVLFKGKVYVGTMDATAIRMMNEGGGGGTPDPSVFANPTGMQIFRFDTSDRWERVMPSALITDQTAVKYAGGFVNMYNRYIWRFGVQGNKLFVGTFDVQTMMNIIGPIFGMTSQAWWNPEGFDLFYTTDGTSWIPESIDGFVDKFNYGVRSFATDPKSGDMFLGTANPFMGCQIWKKKAGIR